VQPNDVVSIIRIGVSLVLVALALRGLRWAYVAFIVVALSHFPMQVGFKLAPHACELTFDGQLALYSLRNFAHIVLFACFFVLSRIHFRRLGRAAWTWAAGATLLMGALVEVAEGVTGSGHCRARDLIPDSAGAVLGALVFLGLAALLRAALRFRPVPVVR
jgi:hypothetical protein